MNCVRYLGASFLGVVLLAGTAGGASAQIGNFLQQLHRQNEQRQNEQPRQNQPASPPASQLQSGGGSGVSSLGTDAVALIEDISEAGSPKQFMDYLFAGDTVQLGSKGRLEISYLSGCLVEKITGGTVTIRPNAADGSNPGVQVSGGRSTQTKAKDCEPLKPVLVASATEAGATANRFVLFAGDWEERTVNAPQPVFKWASGAGPVDLRVVAVDAEPEKVVWQGKTAKDSLEYPKTAPALEPGMGYRVEVTSGGKLLYAARFSTDPSLDLPKTLANRLVPVTGTPK
jgi:hypothetical protein